MIDAKFAWNEESTASNAIILGGFEKSIKNWMKNAPGYDANGNETTKIKIETRDEWAYSYNNVNEMTSAVQTNASDEVEQKITYKYDVFANLIEQDVTIGETTTVTKFAIDAWNSHMAVPTGRRRSPLANLARVLHVRDIRMIHHCQRLAFGFEASQHLIATQTGFDDLQGDAAPGPGSQRSARRKLGGCG